MKMRDLPMGVFHFDCFWQNEFHWWLEFDDEQVPDAMGQLVRMKGRGIESSPRQRERRGLPDHELDMHLGRCIAQESNIFDERVEDEYFAVIQNFKGKTEALILQVRPLLGEWLLVHWQNRWEESQVY